MPHNYGHLNFLIDYKIGEEMPIKMQFKWFFKCICHYEEYEGAFILTLMLCVVYDDVHNIIIV